MSFSLPPSIAGQVIASSPTIEDLYSTTSEEAKLIRLLLGTADFLYTPTNELLKTNKNYAILGVPNSSRRKRAIKNALQVQTIDIERLNEYLVNNLTNNELFFELFEEFARYMYCTKKRKHTQAFLHLYRALERISYTLPIAYASKSKDYKNTFKELRSFISDPKAGELNFFRKFTESIIDSSYLDSIVRFDISNHAANTRNTHYLSLSKLFKGNEIKSRSPNSFIEVQYRSVIPGFIKLRNYYFHFLSGEQNLSPKEIIDEDEFFGSVNLIFANWISFIYFRVLEIRLN